MRISKRVRFSGIFLGTLLIFLFSLSLRAAIGLRSRFSEAILENLEVGRVYNLRELRNLPYQVINAGDIELEVLNEIEIPPKESLTEGYEPIPDPTWIKVIPEKFGLKPGEIGSSDIVILIPDEPQYVGRHYQAAIWSHTVGSGLLGVGVRSRLRLSTGKGPETLAAEKRKRGLVAIDLDLTPSSVYLEGIEIGEHYDVKKMKGVSLKITNRTNSKVQFKLESVPYKPEFGLPPGYERAPESSWLELKPQVLEIKSNRIKESKMFIRIPLDEKHRGKKYAFLAKGEIIAKEILPVEFYTKVYVTVKE